MDAARRWLGVLGLMLTMCSDDVDRLGGAGDSDSGLRVVDASGPGDASPAEDAGFPTDMGFLADAAPMDAMPLDAEPMDAMPLDAMPMDAMPMDAMPMDATVPDGGSIADVGPRDSGVPTCTVTSTALPTGQVRVPYIALLTATGCPNPTWSLGPGSSLPLGLGLAGRTGELFGRPLATFTGQVVFVARQSGFRQGSASLLLQIR